MKFCATPPIHGSLAHYYCHDADFCYKWVWLVYYVMHDNGVTTPTGYQATSHMIMQHYWSLFQLGYMLVNELECVLVVKC